MIATMKETQKEKKTSKIHPRKLKNNAATWAKIPATKKQMVIKTK